MSYAAPAAACASCAAPVAAAPVTTVPVTPAPVVTAPAVTAPAAIAPSLPGPAPQGAAPPPTFEKTEKPATEPELKPIPRPDTQLNSMPAPLLSDPRDRTTARPNHATGAIHLVAAAAATRSSEDNDGWAPARN
jgi:hypothetical protein